MKVIPMKVIFRDLQPSVVEPVREAFPEWDVECAHIFTASGADMVVSPANCIGRMDGGIDGVYLQRFGYQLQVRLTDQIAKYHGGHLSIGQAHLIKTNDVWMEPIPWMISAPTMEWPPGDVSDTENAYWAFKAVLECALTDGPLALNRYPVLLMPGLATTTGRMPGWKCAEQLRKAWDETFP